MISAAPLSEQASAQAIPGAGNSTGDGKLSIDRVVGLMPGFVYVFNHLTYSNDYANRSVAAHLGYSAEEIQDLGADMFMHIVHPDDHPLLGAHMTRIAQMSGEESVFLEYRVITKAGDERWLRSVDAVFDRSADGTVLRHIGYASDITAQKETALRLVELNAELENKVAARTHALAALNVELENRIATRTLEMDDAVEELEQLTYIATHDLKVPVNNLNRLGLMLEEASDSLSDEQAEQVRWINTCAQQLSAKIQGLVLVAQIRLSDGLPPETLVLRDVVQSAVAGIDPAMGSRALPVQMDIAAPLRVRFARSELDSILATLFDNAMKYAQKSRPLQIVVTAREVGGRVALSVADNGSGLDTRRDAAKAFGLFQRAHKLPAGSGISLYCARRMLFRRGGALTLSGRRGAGATFTALFPKEGTE